ncbi:hypothetical protein Q5752_006333 [Cryptotrichosporon argae]
MEDTPASPGSADSAASSSVPRKQRKLADTRSSQACIKCRSQKMRCIGASDPPCRRCRRTKSLCEFVPRANAAAPRSPVPYPSHSCTEIWRGDVSARLKALEQANGRLGDVVKRLVGERAYVDVWDAVERLKADLPPLLSSHRAWNGKIVPMLWDSFRSQMPGLHFVSGVLSLSSPTPLLVASVLHVAASHHPSPELATFQPVYLQAFARAVGALAVPAYELNAPSRPARARDDEERQNMAREKFHDVLGIILVALTIMGRADNVIGLWLSTAYRLLLDGVVNDGGDRTTEWRGLWEGLRIVEMEHSSIHLLCPTLPLQPPDPPFANVAAGPNAVSAIGELITMMQAKLPLFVGQGLPTIWERVSCMGMPASGPTRIPGAFDAIREWAGSVDEWYARYAAQTINATPFVRSLILLNCHLHKLLALSILSTPGPEHEPRLDAHYAEMLASARLLLRIVATGFEVWSSWDLVMITHGSLILLEAVCGGAGQPNDLNLIQNHLNSLTSLHNSAPGLRRILSRKLEDSLQGVRTPPALKRRRHLTSDERDVRTPSAAPAGHQWNSESMEQILASPATLAMVGATGQPPVVPDPAPPSYLDPMFAGAAPVSQPAYQGLGMSDIDVLHGVDLLGDMSGAAPAVPDPFAPDGGGIDWPPFLINMFGPLVDDGNGLDWGAGL